MLVWMVGPLPGLWRIFVLNVGNQGIIKSISLVLLNLFYDLNMTWMITQVCIDVRKARTFFNEARMIRYSIYNIAVVNLTMLAFQ